MLSDSLGKIWNTGSNQWFELPVGVWQQPNPPLVRPRQGPEGVQHPPRQGLIPCRAPARFCLRVTRPIATSFGVAYHLDEPVKIDLDRTLGQGVQQAIDSLVNCGPIAHVPRIQQAILDQRPNFLAANLDARNL